MLSSAHSVRRWLRRVALVIACAFGVAAPVSAGLGDYPFRIERVKGDKYFELIAHNRGPATITLYITMSGENIASDVTWPVTKAVPAYSSLALGKLFPQDPKKPARLGYSQSIQYGDYRATHSPEAKYRLPYQDGAAHRITQAYGDPLTTHIGHHSQHAIDFAMPEGTPVVATRDGVIIDVTLEYDTGGMYSDLRDKANAVAIQHEDGTVAHYGHLSKRTSPVKFGEHVTAGTVIGYAGNTGYSSGPHLHYAVTKPEVLADGRVAHVALPVKFYVDSWTLPFDLRRGALVTASYSQDAAMRAAKTPAEAGKRLLPEAAAQAHANANANAVRTLPASAAGQPGSAPEAPAPVTVARMPADAPSAMPVRRVAVEATVAPVPQADQQVPRQPPPVVTAPVADSSFGMLEMALIVFGALFSVIVPFFFWRLLRT